MSCCKTNPEVSTLFFFGGGEAQTCSPPSHPAEAEVSEDQSAEWYARLDSRRPLRAPLIYLRSRRSWNLSGTCRLALGRAGQE